MAVNTLTYAALAKRLKGSLEAARSLVTGEVATLKARIESLQAELAKLEATAAGNRADYERERDRADRLFTELLKATANTTSEMAAKLEGEIAALRFAAEAGDRADVIGDGCARPADQVGCTEKKIGLCNIGDEDRRGDRLRRDDAEALNRAKIARSLASDGSEAPARGKI
jgi:hypothetical protein